jgi:membrane protein
MNLPGVKRVRALIADRQRLQAFLRFLGNRFIEDRCFETASGLAYATVFAMVPFAAAVFGIISTFPVFEQWSERLTSFVFSNFVPAAARTVETFVREAAGSASQMTLAGVLGLLVVALLLMKGIEDTFNRIWRVPSGRGYIARFLMYWAALTFGPILVVSSVALSSYVFSLPLLADGTRAVGWLLRLSPLVLAWAAFACAFLIVPNRTVRPLHAFAGGGLAALLFESAKVGLTLYLSQVPTYEKIYGALAVIPIFLLWVYLSWIAILLGASFAASLSAFRYLPSEKRLPQGLELLGMLRLLGCFAEAQREGRELEFDEMRLLEPSLSDDALMHLLERLVALRILHRSEDGGWLLVRDLSQVSLREVYSGASLRLPLEPLPSDLVDDERGRRIGERLENLGEDLALRLDTPLSQWLGETPRPSPENSPGHRP